jgi:Uma2 family endonuclease
MATRNHERERLLTIDEYLAFEKDSPVRHEYVGGELVAMAGASDRHNRVAGNIYALLWPALRGGPCRIYMSDMKMQISDDQIFYPDVMVTCDPEDNGEYIKKRPCLIIEVLSPSTASIDRREKLVAYRRIESLQAYIVLYQDQKRAFRHVVAGRGFGQRISAVPLSRT